MIFNDAGVKGADVSFWQDVPSTPQQIDFETMKSAGADFVIIRAGQNTWVDSDFKYNWAKAKGLPRGAYWFYDSRSDPVKQAELFASLFKDDSPELELWLDLEERYGGQWAGYVHWKKFLNRLRQLTNARIGIYTGYGYIKDRIPVDEYAFFAQFPLWLAWYTNLHANVTVPRPWTSCLYWQWGTPSWGLEWGCESKEIDMNLFNGTREQFNSRYGATMPEITPYVELKPSLAGEYRSIRDETNYPTVPHIFGASSIANRILVGNFGKAEPNGSYVYNSDVYVNNVLSAKAGDIWWRVYEANGNPADGWVSEIHKGIRYLNVRLVNDIPSPEEPVVTHVIEILSNGKLVIDGFPYS